MILPSLSKGVPFLRLIFAGQENMSASGDDRTKLNDVRFAADLYATASLHRYRSLSSDALNAERDVLSTENHRDRLAKISWTSLRSFLGYLALVALLLAFAFVWAILMEGVRARDTVELCVGLAALGYFAWFCRYEKRTDDTIKYRTEQIQIIDLALRERD